MVHFVTYSVVFHLHMFSFSNFVSLRYNQLSLGNRVATVYEKGLPILLVICSFCDSLIVFVCLSLWC